MNKDRIEDIYVLSPMQQGMIFHTLLNAESKVYFQQESYIITGDLQAGPLRQAWQLVLNRHPALRTTFLAERRDKPLQVVHRQVNLPWEEMDWRGLSPDEQQASLAAFLEADRARGFELSQAPLLRVTLIRMAEQEYHFIWRFHHAILDKWSVALLFREVFNIYHAQCAGRAAGLAAPRPYRDYITWLRQQDVSRAEAYWRGALSGFTTPTTLRRDRLAIKESEQANEYIKQGIKLSKETTAALQALGRQHQLTLNTLVQSAWGLLLSHYSGEPDVIFGNAVSGRPSELPGAEEMVGLFINTLPVRVRVRPDAMLLDWLRELQDQQVQARQYGYSPLVEVQGWSEVPRGKPLFESLLIFESLPVDAATQTLGADLQIRSGHIHDRSHYPLAVLAWPGAELSLQIWHDGNSYRQATIARMLQHLQRLLEAMVANPPARLCELSLLSDAERQQIIFDWNETKAEFPEESPLQELFEQQVLRTPDAIALECAGQRLTYQELNQRANQLAHFLIKAGASSSSPIAVCMDHSLETLVGLFAVLKAGAHYLPINPQYPQQRISFMLRDAQVKILLTQERYRDALLSDELLLLCLDQKLEGLSDESKENPANTSRASDLAYIIYTSGSTGQPKGVQIQHRALVNYLWWAKDVYLQGENLSCALYSSLAFDLTVTSLYLPLLTGNRVLVYEKHGVETPLFDVLRDNQVELLKLTPSHLMMLKEMDNRGSRLRRLIVGGEGLETKLAREVLESFGGEVEIYNEYGPTEATVGCMLYRYQAERDLGRAVPIGRAAANTEIYVLDERLEPVADNVIGELYIGGEGLAVGYLNREELTSERFIAHPFKEGARLYRTGDLARRLTDGNLEYVGRRDEQVKYHGYRIELAEIRSALNDHPQVRDSVVLVARDTNESDVLVAYYVSRQELEAAELHAWLKERIIAETIPAVFIHLRKLPLTLNGKVNQRALPTLAEARGQSARVIIEPRTPVEARLAAIWSEVLRVEHIGVLDNLFELGAHSLLATQVISRIREAFHLELPLRTLFEQPTVSTLAASIEELLKSEQGIVAPPIIAVSREQSLPLSFAQQRLWFLDQLQPGSPAYNIPAALRLRGKLCVAALEESLSEVVRRHEVLRTTYRPDNGEPVQLIHPATTLSLPLLDLSQLPTDEREANARRMAEAEARKAFDLQNGPLMRASLLRLDEEEHVLLWTMHHIVSDGWSVGLLLKEVATLYLSFSEGQPSPLPELKLQYADFAHWQRNWLQGEVLEAQLAYWRKQLSGTLPVLELPASRKRPAVQSHLGAYETFNWPPALAESLKALSRREGVTLYNTLLAAYKTLLCRYTGQTDVMVGTGIANRNRAETEGLIGFFVNMLVLRTDLSGNPTFRELLARVREVTLDAYAHQDIPFEKLVEELQPERRMDRMPLIQTVFVLQNLPATSMELPGLKLEALGTDSGMTHFDLMMHVEENRQGLTGRLEYATDLFDSETILLMLKHYRTLLEEIVAQPEQRLLDIPLPLENQDGFLAPSAVRTEAFANDQFVF